MPILAIARIGVGIGEATAAPCAYALLSAYFRPERRATVLAIYSSGLYFGAGLSLFLGGLIAHWWNTMFPGGWMGIVGWRAAFLMVGMPGLLLALLVTTLREPATSVGTDAASAHPLRILREEVMIMLPPLTLIAAARRGAGALATNAAVGAVVALAVVGAIQWSGDIAQWCVLGVGGYAVFSWAADLRARDEPTFALIWRSPPFILLVAAYGLNAAIGYAVSFWTMPYAEQSLGLNRSTAGLLIGGCTAMGGFSGAIAGGWIADALRRRWPTGRMIVVLVSFLAPIPLYLIAFSTRDVTLFYALLFPMSALSSSGLGAVAATTQDLVLPRMRGAATATFYLGITLLGLAIGPYAAGRISMWSGDLATGVISTCALAGPATIALLIVIRRLPATENRNDR
jgi:MFS family permease